MIEYIIFTFVCNGMLTCQSFSNLRIFGYHSSRWCAASNVEVEAHVHTKTNNQGSNPYTKSPGFLQIPVSTCMFHNRPSWNPGKILFTTQSSIYFVRFLLGSTGQLSVKSFVTYLSLIGINHHKSNFQFQSTNYHSSCFLAYVAGSAEAGPWHPWRHWRRSSEAWWRFETARLHLHRWRLVIPSSWQKRMWPGGMLEGHSEQMPLAVTGW